MGQVLSALRAPAPPMPCPPSACRHKGDNHACHRRPLSPAVVVRPLGSSRLLCTAHVCSKLSLCASSQEHSVSDSSVIVSACVPGSTSLDRLMTDIEQVRHWFRLMACAHEPYVWTLRLSRGMLFPRATSCSSGGEHGIDTNSLRRLWWQERRRI